MESGTQCSEDSDNGGLTPDHNPDHNSSAAAAPSVEMMGMVSLVSIPRRGERGRVYVKKGGKVSKKIMTEKTYRHSLYYSHTLTYAHTYPPTHAYTYSHFQPRTTLAGQQLRSRSTIGRRRGYSESHLWFWAGLEG